MNSATRTVSATQRFIAEYDAISQTYVIVADLYTCTILPNEILVYSKVNKSFRCIIKNGSCTCETFAKVGNCVHETNVKALLEVEIARLKALLSIVPENDFMRTCIQWGTELLEANEMEMSIELYRKMADANC